MTADELVEKVADAIKDNTVDSDYARAAVRIVIEECLAISGSFTFEGGRRLTAEEISSAIRALSPKEPG
jgi:hypothetical protein